MKHSIAIVVIAYNRDRSLARLLDSIGNAYIDKDTTLIVSIDKSNNPLVAKVANDYDWKYGKKEVVCHKKNLGLRKHILGSGKYLDNYDAIIILEDDIIVSRYFYLYAMLTVHQYYKDRNIAGISLYGFQTVYHNFKPFIPQKNIFDVYFMQNAQSWGQIWMREQWWEFMEWYRNNNGDFGEQPHLPKSICSWKKSSWLKYHTKYCIESGKFFVYPYTSFSSNACESGTHASFSTPLFEVPLREFEMSNFKLPKYGDDVVEYDSFFENNQIYKSLGINSQNLCVDLNGLKGNREEKRFWLTTRAEKYKVLKSFGLSMRPVENNVFYDIEGNDIFLYDISVPGDMPVADNRKSFYYFNGFDIAHIGNVLKEFGFVRYIKMMIKIAISKL